MIQPPVPFCHCQEHRAPGRRLALFLAFLVGGLLAGCQSADGPRVRLKSFSSDRGEVYQVRNHFAVPALPVSVRRVAMLPLHGEQWREDVVARFDSVLREAAARTERFEIVAISRQEMANAFGERSLDSTRPLPGDLLARLQANRGVDAVLLLDLTHLASYQPVAVGLRARLVTVEQGESLWAFDAIFDAARDDVSLAARRFSNETKRPPSEQEDGTAVLQSPLRFARYAGAAMFATLPPRRAE